MLPFRAMSVRAWAIKPGELKPLARAGKLIFAARCAMRTETWVPPASRTLWNQGLDDLARAAFVPPTSTRAILKLARDLDERGVLAETRLSATDEPRGRCISYAMHTLANALRASCLADGPELRKAVIDVAKYSASIAALLAHAGRTRAPKGVDAVDDAAGAIWAAIRADVPIVADGCMGVESAKDHVKAIRSLAPMWPKAAPEWAT